MTFSIVLRDSEENSFGIAVATKHFAVGALVPQLRAGVGAVAVQSAPIRIYDCLGWSNWLPEKTLNKR